MKWLLHCFVNAVCAILLIAAFILSIRIGIWQMIIVPVGQCCWAFSVHAVTTTLLITSLLKIIFSVIVMGVILGIGCLLALILWDIDNEFLAEDNLTEFD